MAEKLDRDALKGPDEFTVLVRRLLSWTAAHRRALTVAGVLVGVLVLAVSVAAWNRARATQQAAELFRRAHTAFRGERFPEAARAFEDVAREYPGTAFGRFALLYRGHALRAAGDAAGAAAAYEEYLAHGADAAEFEQLALVSLGRIREDGGDLGSALEVYQRAAELEGPYALEAGLAVARLQIALGRPADARATYERILPDATGEVKTLVEARLASLRDAS